MSQRLYIRSACAVTPQHSFPPAQLLQPVASSHNNRLFVIDQDYSKYISPVAIRRMSRLIKASISAGMQCLQNAGITKPDGIITGTGRGSVTDMQHFMKDMLAYKEEALNPTYFIQSTYNSVNGWLALQTKCNGYNQTYVHRGFSFELAMLDALLLLKETKATRHYLVGAYDEITDEYYHIRNKAGYWKKDAIDSLSLFRNTATTGTIAGEGSVFFTVSNDQGDAVCTVDDVQMLQQPTSDTMNVAVGKLLQKNDLQPADIDVVLCGMNGDAANQALYNSILPPFTSHSTVAAYKHLSGEYDTAAAFGAWMAHLIFSNDQVPDVAVLQQGNHTAIKRVLMVNNYILNNASLMLLSRA